MTDKNGSMLDRLMWRLVGTKKAQESLGVYQPPMFSAKNAINNIFEWITSNRVDTISSHDRAILYATSVGIYAASNYRARNIASVKMNIINPDGDIINNPQLDTYQPDHMLTHIFRQGSSYSKLMRRNEFSWCMYGYWVDHIGRNAQGVPVDMKWLNPYSIRVDADNYRGLQGFQVLNGYNTEHTGGYIYPEDAVFVHGMDFTDDFDGVAPAEVAFLYGESDSEMAQTYASIFRNMAIPALYGQPTEDYLKSARSNFKESDAKNITAQFRQIARGSANIGKTMISAHRLEFERLQPVLKDLDTKNIREQVEHSISMAFEMPVDLILMNASNYAQAEVARRSWGESWLVPQVTLYAEGFTSQLAEKWGEGWTVEPDLDSVAILKENTSEKVDLQNKQLQAGGITYGSYQTAIGVDVIPELENMVFVPALGAPVPLEEVPNLWKSLIAKGAPQNDIAPTTNGYLPPAQTPLLPAPQKAWLPAEEYGELKSWRKCAKKYGIDYNFDVSAIRGDVEHYIKSSLSSGLSIDIVFESADRRLRGAKAIQATRLDFEDRFESFLIEVQGETITRRRAGTIMRSILDRFGVQAFVDGLVDGGVTGGEIDEDDRKTINRLQSDNSGYVTDFLNRYYKDEDRTLSDEEIQQKILQWWNKSVKIFYDEGLQSANGNQMLEFAGNDGAESCPTCVRLKGQRHRAKAWKSRRLRPGIDTGNFECGGFNCQHILVPTDQRAFGKFPSAKSLNIIHDHNHDHKPVVLDITQQPYTEDEYRMYHSTKGYTA